MQKKPENSPLGKSYSLSPLSPRHGGCGVEIGREIVKTTSEGRLLATAAYLTKERANTRTGFAHSAFLILASSLLIGVIHILDQEFE